MLRWRTPQRRASARRGVHPLSEDRSLFDGPRATYGRFRLLHQIGAGSVGPVFRGEDGETRQRVVIKVIRVGLTPERVAIVGAALASLRDRLPDHPALAPLIDTGVVDVEPYLVTPWIDGDSLDVALREYGPANLADALPRLRTLADAMDAAAAVGIAHGSLHLRDVVVSVDRTVLTGIGVASVLERVGVRPPVRRPYCAPEVALGHGIGPAGDQYSLAAIAHEWLSGRRLAGVGLASFQVPATSAAGADALRAVFARALDESPDGRYPTVTAFVEALADRASDAAPRPTRAPRRVSADETPRLAFDDAPNAPEPTDHDSIPTGPADASLVGIGMLLPADDLAAGALIGGDAAVPDAPERMGWDAAAEDDTAPAVAFASIDDDDGDDGDDDVVVAERDDHEDEVVVRSVADDADHSDVPVGPMGIDPAEAEALELPVADPYAPESEPDPGDDVPRSWAAWAGVLAVVTLAAIAGGWALLRWSTPAARQTAAQDPSGTVPAAPSPTPSAPSGARTTPVTATTAPASSPSVTPPDPVPEPPTEPAAGAAAVRRDPAQERSVPPPPAPSAAQRAAPAAPTHRPPPPAAPPGRPAASAGRLLVRTTPVGAEVFVNGERRGVTPLTLRALAYGTYAVRLTSTGFTASEHRIVLDARRPSRSLEVTLTRARAVAATPPPLARPTAAAATGAAPATGSLLVESRPSGARVLLDGRDVGVTPLTIPSLAAGSYTVRIERAGFAPISTTTRVEARTRARVGVTLTEERPR